MPLEIERKFLVTDDSFLNMATKSIDIQQGYLSTSTDATVRIRVTNQEAYLTIKGRNKGSVRGEWEYTIPMEDAQELMSLCKSKLSKVRYIVPYNGNKWEVDVFRGKLKGLVLAEIELPSEDYAFDMPPFVGDEVTNVPYYYNSNLSHIEN